MHTGQNSTAPENSFPQLEQMRLASVFMGLTALLRTQPEGRKERESRRRSLPEVILERGEQERPELTNGPVNAAKRPMLQQVAEKTLSQVVSVIRRMPAAAGENVEWIEPAQLGQSPLPPLRLIRQLPDRPHDDHPARGVKARRALRQRTVVAFHEEIVFYQQ
jgi:hypothetical protein